MTGQPLNPAAVVRNLDALVAHRDRLAAELAAAREREQRVRVLFGDWAEAIPTYILRAALAGEGADDQFVKENR